MKTTVLTRNFKKQTSAKYCTLVFGESGDEAVETEKIKLFNARKISTIEHSELRGLENFGCGIVIIGNDELPEQKKLDWDGLDFKVDGKDFLSATELNATPDGIFVR